MTRPSPPANSLTSTGSQPTEDVEDFVSRAVHDFRAPIRQIRAFSGFLVEDLGEALSADAARNIEFIQEGAQRLDVLVDGYADLALVTARELNLDEISIATGMSPAKGNADAAMDRSAPHVFADGGVMRVVWGRILDAAVRLSRNPEAIKVSVESTADAVSAIVVRVSDPGLDPSDVSRAFLPIPVFAGHAHDPGMALAICHSAVVRMGGELKAIADSEGQLTLNIELPSRCPEQPVVSGERTPIPVARS